jgi:hypothetical protein
MGRTRSSFYSIHGPVDGGGGKQRRVLAHGRQLHIAKTGQLAVVIAEHRYIGRNLQTVCAEALDQAQGRSVVEGYDSRRRIIPQGPGSPQTVLLTRPAGDYGRFEAPALHFAAKGFAALLG